MTRKLCVILSALFAAAMCLGLAACTTTSTSTKLVDDDTSPSDDDSSPTDDDDSADDDDNDNDDNDNDDNDNDDSYTCQSVYDDMYVTCGYAFQDGSGNQIPETQIVQYCEANQYCLGVNEQDAQCIEQNWGSANCQAMGTCLQNLPPCSDDDDDNDDDSSYTCQSVYDDMYSTCGYAFQDQNGNQVPESQIVQYCEANQYCLGLSQQDAQCIEQNWGASNCQAMGNCLQNLPPCGDDDDDTAAADAIITGDAAQSVQGHHV